MILPPEIAEQLNPRQRDDRTQHEFPLWSLALTEGDEVQSTIPPLLVPVVYRVSTTPAIELEMNVISTVSVYNIIASLSTGLQSFQTVPQLLIYDLVYSNSIQVQGITNHGSNRPE